MDLNPVNWIKRATNPKTMFDPLGLFDVPKQPAAPDYTGAAEATAAGNLKNARYATQANRPNQVTPWGNMSWQQAPNTTAFDQAMSQWQAGDQSTPAPTIDQFPSDKWTQTTTLSPGQQQIFDVNQQSDLAQSNLSLTGINQAKKVFSTPFSLDSLGNLPSYADRRKQIEDAMLGRVTTDVARNRETKSSQLIASGIPPGSEAYTRQMEQFDRQLTDARQQAEIAATQQTSTMQNADINARRQKISEILTGRQTPLNEAIGWRSGTQVQMPQFSPFANQQATLGPNYSGAANATGQWNLAGWNANVAQKNAEMSGLFSLGAAAVGGK